ncbi:MAG: DUF1580 domain-containing protein [Planctomycetaceae bacterium]
MRNSLLWETRISLAEAGRLAGNVNPATIWRWRTKGVKGVKLETFAIGGRQYTTREALERFITGVTAAKEAIYGEIADAEARSESTERQLRAAGLL